MNLLRLLVLLFCLGGINTAFAGLEKFDFSGNVDEERYKELILELRCLVCQNQSLGDSDAELAHDLRREVYDLMNSGQSDDQIVDFLVTRYGDFVLYNPPVKPDTYLLWFGPFALLVIGILVLLRTVRQRQKQTAPEISAEEQARLNKILADADAANSNSNREPRS